MVSLEEFFEKKINYFLKTQQPTKNHIQEFPANQKIYRFFLHLIDCCWCENNHLELREQFSDWLIKLILYMCSLQHYLADVGISCAIVIGMVLLLLPCIMLCICQVFLTSLSFKLAAHNIFNPVLLMRYNIKWIV